MSQTCDAPSPGGGLRCVREPHPGPGGHLWEDRTAGGDRKEDIPARWNPMPPKGGYMAADF